MFEELSERQLQQLEKVWTTAAKSVHWRENLRYEMSKALATGCTLEHLAAVTGFDHQTIERLRHELRNDFNGRHPTDRPRTRARAVLPVAQHGSRTLPACHPSPPSAGSRRWKRRKSLRTRCGQPGADSGGGAASGLHGSPHPRLTAASGTLTILPGGCRRKPGS